MRPMKRNRTFRPILTGLERRDCPSTFTVANTLDSGPGSLRNAVQASNALAGADIIQFDPTVTGTIHLTSGELLITDNLTILGPGSSTLAISGENHSRVFEVQGANATIQGLSIQNGLADVGAGAAVNLGTLNLVSDTFANNHATGYLGGGAVEGSVSTINVVNDTFVGNTADFNGGAITNGTFNTLNVSTSIFVANTAKNAGGGAIYNWDQAISANVSNSVFAVNSAKWGGAILNNSDLTVNSDMFMANRAESGGAVYNIGSGHSTINSSTFQYNTASYVGGAIYSGSNLVLSNSTIQNNQASNGGGVLAKAGTLSTIADVITQNVPNDVVLV